MGASIINDISGGSYDSSMFKTAAKLNVPLIIMHMQGRPENMQKKPFYKMRGMPNGHIIGIEPIIPGLLVMQSGACTIITGDVVIIFVIVV